MTNSTVFKNSVAVILAEASNDVMNNFFHSEGNELSKWTKEGDAVWNFVTAAEEAGITYEHSDSYGGEGMGDEYWSVYKFTKGEDSVFVKFNGSYQSYNGADFDEYFFVKREEKVVTVFTRSK